MVWCFRREIVLIVCTGISLLFLRMGWWKQAPGAEKKVLLEPRLNYEELIRENRRLRHLLGLQEKRWPCFSFVVVAEVIKVQPAVWPGQIVVNKGKKEGVRENMVVVSSEGVLIGRVIAVEESSATVFTIFHPSTKLSVMVQRTREIGILEGASLPYLLVRYLPKDSKAQSGDKVITSGLSDYYPKGLPVGTIFRIDPEKSQYFYLAWVKPEAGFERLDEVLIGH